MTENLKNALNEIKSSDSELEVLKMIASILCVLAEEIEIIKRTVTMP